VCELRFLEFSGPRIFSNLHSGAWQLVETDCVAGVVGLELRNVGANYIFEVVIDFLGSTKFWPAETIRV
jgi:hypothetical protein